MSEALLPVVVLAGGKATRLEPVTRTIPKALVDVNGEPFAFHQLRGLAARGVREVLFCVGHLGEQIMEAVGDGAAFRLRVEYALDGPTLLGTGGALEHALPKLPDAFFVLYGDSYLECDFRAVQAAFRAAAKAGLMTVFGNDGRWDGSNVEFTEGRILAHDKAAPSPRMRHIDYGLGVLHRRAFALVRESAPYDLARLYQRLLTLDELAAFEVVARFYEIGSLEGLEETRRHLAALREARRS